MEPHLNQTYLKRMAKVEREDIFKFVNEKQWLKLIGIFSDNIAYKVVLAEPMLQPLIDKYFIDELVGGLAMQTDVSYKYYLQNIHQIHVSKKHSFKLSSENYRKLVVKIVQVESNVDHAYNYAKEFPEDPVCQEIIAKFNERKPVVVAHSQDHNLYVTENKNLGNVDYTTSLFKSNQEYHFFKAVREVFPTFFVLPNVAFGAVIDIQALKPQLSKEELNHFYSGLIDCVVVDTENNYRPVSFFELDSPYHDNALQKAKDLLKDSILAKAGQKLLRIRRTEIQSSEQDFVRYIRESLK
jgi:hypothetical protein